MSCSENTIPCGCENNPCGCKISSDDVAYQGPDLNCTGINNCDTLTTAIQKIDEFVCGLTLVETIIYNIQNNTNLYNQFTTIVNQTVSCQKVFDCLETTTTTTTEAPIPAYCYSLGAVGRVIFFWLDANGVAQFADITDDVVYACARLDSIVTSGPGLPEIDGGIDLCTTDSQCTPTTTTTTTTILCNCIEILIDQDDLNDATGNSLPEVNNTLFLSGPNDVLCEGGLLPESFTIGDIAYKYCVNVDAIPLLGLYYYKDNVVTTPSQSSITDTTNDCTIDGNCVD